jgi:hypothetical protein
MTPVMLMGRDVYVWHKYSDGRWRWRYYGKLVR